MSEDYRILLEYKPVGAPRRRLIFERDRGNPNLEHDHWLIEQAYDVADGCWHETGREHVDEPELVIEREGVIAAPETTADAEGSADV
ncbi:hypothetical protein [Halobellus rufus]|uniref:hypothetical protein n=1 Tax=Halobellus rufus TaxID=1448860 RepID=UPI0012E04359|nr:hypothetical protein [Halobellus rufus]